MNTQRFPVVVLVAEFSIPASHFGGEKFTEEGVASYCNVGLQHLQSIIPHGEFPMKLDEPVKLKVYETLRGCSVFEWMDEIPFESEVGTILAWIVVFYLIRNQPEIILGETFTGGSFYLKSHLGDVIRIYCGKSRVDDLWSVHDKDPDDTLCKGSFIYVFA